MMFVSLFDFRQAKAQQIALDRGIKAESLWCFPLVKDSLQYLFLPNDSHLALDKQNNPEFSFIRYVNNIPNTTQSGNDGIRQAAGGGILHFLVTYNTEEKEIARSQNKLRQLLNNNKITIQGPVIFTEGRYALVSSILNPENGRGEKKVLAQGGAPVLEGSRIALSFELDSARSKLLLESFKMNTPDISLVFSLSFQGLTDAYNANMTVNWDDVRKYKKTGGGANLYFLSADIEKMYQALQRTSAITLQTNGKEPNMEALVANMYSRLTDIIFKEDQPEALSGQNGTSERNDLLSKSIDNLIRDNVFSGISAQAIYKRREIATSGSSVFYFNSRTISSRQHYITFNISKFYKEYGKNPNYFKTVSLNDPDFEQRNIYVGVDGSLMPEFDKLINNVTITLRKQHADGNTTLRQVNITKSSFNTQLSPVLSYDAVGDSDRMAWLNYEYKAQFDFKGGKRYETLWQSQSASMINVFVPYERKTIRLECDAALLKEKDVRAVIIQIEYPFFGDTRKIETFLKPEENIESKIFDITMPLNQLMYHYTLKWKFKNGTEKVSSGDNDHELLFLDNIPEQ